MLTSQEVVDLLDTQTYFELLKLPYPTEQAGVVERLLNDHLVNQRGEYLFDSAAGGIVIGEKVGRLS